MSLDDFWPDVGDPDFPPPEGHEFFGHIEEGGTSDDPVWDWDFPPEPNYPEYDWEDMIGGIPEDLYFAWEYVVEFAEAELGNVRGVGFETVYEALEWLAGIGVIGFSHLVYDEGNDLYFPEIGDSPGPAKK